MIVKNFFVFSRQNIIVFLSPEIHFRSSSIMVLLTCKCLNITANVSGDVAARKVVREDVPVCKATSALLNEVGNEGGGAPLGNGNGDA